MPNNPTPQNALKVHKTHLVYKNPWMKVFDDEVEFHTGQLGTWGYIERQDGVGALITTPENKVLLVHEYRHPIHEFQWKIPGGAIDAGESPEQAIRREVLEETGISVAQLQALGSFYPLSSLSSEVTHLFWAPLNTEPAIDANKDPSENNEFFTEKRFVPLTEALKMLDAGKITDPSTGNALQILARRVK